MTFFHLLNTFKIQRMNDIVLSEKDTMDVILEKNMFKDLCFIVINISVD